MKPSTQTTMDINKFVILAGMSLLFVVYAYLNIGKLQYGAGHYREISHGAPAPLLTLRVAGETLAGFRLPSTGFFDATGQYQLNYRALDEASYQRLRQHFDETEVYWNGQAVKARKLEQKTFLALLLPRRKIYLVKDHDAKTIAALQWNENRRVQDVMRCSGKALCAQLRYGWTGGVGPLQGPFLDSDLMPQRRGMPRGRWGLGPATPFVIEARQATRARLSLLLLDTSPGQEVRIVGPGVDALAKGRVKTKLANIAGKRFYPKRYLAKIFLQPGRNEFRIDYGDWAAGRGKPAGQAAAYLIHLDISGEE